MLLWHWLLEAGSWGGELSRLSRRLQSLRGWGHAETDEGFSGSAGAGRAYGELGYLYKEQQLYEAAISSYEAGLKLQPVDRVLKEGLAACREALAGSFSHHDVGPGIRIQHAGSYVDAHTAYATLTEIEKRL